MKIKHGPAGTRRRLLLTSAVKFERQVVFRSLSKEGNCRRHNRMTSFWFFFSFYVPNPLWRQELGPPSTSLRSEDHPSHHQHGCDRERGLQRRMPINYLDNYCCLMIPIVSNKCHSEIRYTKTSFSGEIPLKQKMWESRSKVDRLLGNEFKQFPESLSHH